MRERRDESCQTPRRALLTNRSEAFLRLSPSVTPTIARRPPLPAQVNYNTSCGPSAPNMSLRTQSFTTRRRSCLALCLDRVASRLQLAVDLRTFGILGDLVEHLHRPAPPSARDCSRPASAAKIPASSSRDQLVCAFVRVSAARARLLGTCVRLVFAYIVRTRQ